MVSLRLYMARFYTVDVVCLKNTDKKMGLDLKSRPMMFSDLGEFSTITSKYRLSPLTLVALASELCLSC